MSDGSGALPETPLTVGDVGGCTCHPDGFNFEAGDISPACGYHAAAARQPWNHRIPWNCPTYWDGCRCPGGPYFPSPTTAQEADRG